MFFQKRPKVNGEGSHEVNMTPLIDVSLVLVVMLLLATPLAFESSIAVKSSKKSGRKAVTDIEDERVEVHIVSDDSVQVNRVMIPKQAVGVTLKPLMEKSHRKRVIVACAEQVSHGTFVFVLDNAKLCGASEIAVIGD